MRKRVLAVVLACMLTGVLCACGDKQESSVPEIAADSEQTEDAEAASDAEEKTDASDEGAKSLDGMSFEEVESYLASLPETSDSEDWETSTEYSEEGEVCLMHYEGDDTIVIIPEEIDGLKVTELDMWCFTNNESIVAIKLNSSITTLQEKQFVNCDALQYVTGAENIETVKDAVAVATELKCIRFSEKLTSMEPGALVRHDGCVTVYVKEGSWAAENQDELFAPEEGYSTIEIY